MRGRLGALVLGCLLPTVALAQTRAAPPPSGKLVRPTPGTVATKPNDMPYPTEPWNLYNPWSRAALGDLVRYIEIPAQTIVVTVAVVPPAASLPVEWRPTEVTIPGYSVAETTAGFVLPARWTLEQLHAGMYQWRLLPAEFRRK